MTADPSSPQDSLRERVLDAAAALLARDGRDALTTRSVAAAAGVQPPVLYRLFGDKSGLLDAVALRGYETYLREKALERRAASADPLDDLRRGWDLHVAFGLSHPALYHLLLSKPYSDQNMLSSADQAGRAHLIRKIEVLARGGRLRMGVERAALLFHAACSGTVLTLLSLPERQRDLDLSVLAREGALSTIALGVTPSAVDGLGRTALTLKAQLPEAARLSPGERLLLVELLDRLVDQG